LTKRIITAGVAEFIIEIGLDPLGDIGSNRGGGIVVQIDHMYSLTLDEMGVLLLEIESLPRSLIFTR
jgi:hypothetical protein